MAETTKPKLSTIRRWIRRGFITWAFVSTAWLVNSVRTQGVDPAFLRSSAAVSLVDGDMVLEFLPTTTQVDTGLIFFCGSGIAAEAYAPLLHPIAEEGYRVCIVRLPWRFAPMESHRQKAIDRAIRLIQDCPEISNWVVSGHSLGGALACRAVSSKMSGVSGAVLLGTTHPKADDLSWCSTPVTKVYASKDRIAPPEVVLANKKLLPSSTRWVEIKGGNHSQFGHYGHQLLDGTPTISRNDQQQMACSAILDMLHKVSGNNVQQPNASDSATGAVSNSKSSPPNR